MDDSSRSKAALGIETDVGTQEPHSVPPLASFTDPTSGVEGGAPPRESHIQKHRSSTFECTSNIEGNLPALEPLNSVCTEVNAENDRKASLKEHHASCSGTPSDSVGDISALDHCSRQRLTSAGEETSGFEGTVLARWISTELRTNSLPGAHLESGSDLCAQSSHTKEHTRSICDAMLDTEPAVLVQNTTEQRLAPSFRVISRAEILSAQVRCVENLLASASKATTSTEGVVPSQYTHNVQPLSSPPKAPMSSGGEVSAQETFQERNTAVVDSGTFGGSNELEEGKQESRTTVKRISQSSQRPERLQRRRDASPRHPSSMSRQFSQPRLSSPSCKPSKQRRTQAKICTPETNNSTLHSSNQRSRCRSSKAKDSFRSHRSSSSAQQPARRRQSSREKRLGEQGHSFSSSSSECAAMSKGRLQTLSEHHQPPSSGGRGKLRVSESEMPSTSRKSVEDSRMRLHQPWPALSSVLRPERGPSGDELRGLEELDRVGEFFYEVTIHLSPTSAGPPLRTVVMRRRSKPRPSGPRAQSTSPLKSPPRSDSTCPGEPCGNGASAEQLNTHPGFPPSPLISSQVEGESAGPSSSVSEPHLATTVDKHDRQDPSPPRISGSVLPTECTSVSSEERHVARPKSALQRTSKCPLCQQEETLSEVHGTRSIGATKPPGDAVCIASSAPKHKRRNSAPATFRPAFPLVPLSPSMEEKRGPVIIVLPLRASAVVENMLPSLLKIDAPLKNVSAEKAGCRTYILSRRCGEAQAMKDGVVGESVQLILAETIEGSLNDSDPEVLGPCNSDRGGQTMRVITASPPAQTAPERIPDCVIVPQPQAEREFTPPSVVSPCTSAPVYPFSVHQEASPSFESDSVTQLSTMLEAEDCSLGFHHAVDFDSTQGPPSCDTVVRTSATSAPEQTCNAESPSAPPEAPTSLTTSTDEITTNFNLVLCNGPQPAVDTEAFTAAEPLQLSAPESPSGTASASASRPAEVPFAFGDDSTQDTLTSGAPTETIPAILLKASTVIAVAAIVFFGINFMRIAG